MANSSAWATALLGRWRQAILGRWTGHRRQPLQPLRAAMAPADGKTAVVSLLLAGLLLSAFAGIASSQQRGLLPGEKITLDQCLQFSVMAMRDRDGVLDQFDWITVRVENDCPESRRFLVVELVVIDPVGQTYGGKLWVLGRGEVLRPGGAKTEHYAVPDPGNRKPHRWMARLIYVEAPGSRRKSPPSVAAGKITTRRFKSRKITARRLKSRKIAAGKITAGKITARRLKTPSRIRRIR